MRKRLAGGMVGASGIPVGFPDGKRRQRNGAAQSQGIPTGRRQRLPIADSSCFWILARLNDPGDWLGG